MKNTFLFLALICGILAVVALVILIIMPSSIYITNPVTCNIILQMFFIFLVLALFFFAIQHLFAFKNEHKNINKNK